MTAPPFVSEYQLTPEDVELLTPADVVGPDGLVYPNWRKVGVQGGIPDVPVALHLDDLGAVQLMDISGLIEEACEIVGASGGGAVLIGPGTYYLDELVTISQSNVVIRGSGRESTRLIFRYSLVNQNAMTSWAITNTWPEPAAFMFLGDPLEEVDRYLAEDGKRGDTQLKLIDVGDLQPGDKFLLRAPVTARWQSIVYDQSYGAWGTKTAHYEITAVDAVNDILTLSQPLRIEYPVIDGSYLRRLFPIERSGLESMTIEHTDKLPLHTVCSQWAWNCWVKDLRVLNSGRSGVHWSSAKWCEVRDSEFDSTWNHGGGMAYGGFTQTTDCLMENCLWINYRHAPVVQFGAQGNVFRNSTFEGSDAQWHAGWSTENLYENCTILPARTVFADSTPRDILPAYGTYRFGMYSTPSHDTSHGPNGPRNVVYNCDVNSIRDGVYARGASENWLFLHNRFNVYGNGAGGFYAESGFFNTIIRNNVFILEDETKPMVFLRTADCVGIELVDNTVYGGSGTIVDGVIDVAINEGNQAMPALVSGEAYPARPLPNPSSIYDWQRIPGPPAKPDSLYFAIESASSSSREIVLYWQGEPEQTYTLQYSENLTDGFVNVIASDIQATPPTNVYVHKPGTATRWFYRLVSE
ncbi:right-handed parallel beta-helix repeat-containing protein [Cerasicoccus fimbriatus]|uniref:right-handed parallel beta-helix repeat-containing protein n=1 Tax=Cerasicoccus fimbriatus TaxID=3014554 RepID=UPI0022B52E94|nr:right-handed parallel beta-helix repeat-containing protein [Cerasicoccus sp. TK19100]